MYCIGVLVQLLMPVKVVRRMTPRKLGNYRHFGTAWCLQDGLLRRFGLPNFHLIVVDCVEIANVACRWVSGVRVHWVYCVIWVCTCPCCTVS